MNAGEIVTAPDGERIVLAGIGTSLLLDTPQVRIWDVSLSPGELHPWHLHRNPYVVLSVTGGSGRMDWLYDHPPRFIEEHAGGAVLRPVSPVHQLTNVGDRPYQNRLIELKALGEAHPEGPVDIGSGARSSARPSLPRPLSDGRVTVLDGVWVTVWLVEVPGNMSRTLQLEPFPHILARHEVVKEPELSRSVRQVAGGPTSLTAETSDEVWFVVAMNYMHPDHDLDAYRAR